MILIMLGAPGTGKGTIGALLSEYYGIPHISTGNLFRDAVKKNVEGSDILKEYMDKGLLIPDANIEKIIENRIQMLDCKNGFILDGYPRTLDQAKAFEELLKRKALKLTAVINLETPTDEIVDRIVNRLICEDCGAIYNKKYSKPVIEGHCDICDGKLISRSDDTEEKVLIRLNEYHDKTRLLNKYYKDQDKMFNVLVSKKVEKLGKEVVKDIAWYIEGLEKN